MSKTYWITRDINGLSLWQCTPKAFTAKGMGVFGCGCTDRINCRVVLDDDTFYIAPGECVEVRLKFERVEGISTAQTKAAKKKRLEGRIGE